MKKSITNNKMINLFIVFALFCFFILVYRVSYLALSTKVDGVNLKEFASSRSVVSKTIYAKRGNIYDVNGESLAINVSSYTLIAYLDESRSEGENKLYHVKDKKTTAKKLAEVIDMKESEIYKILNQDDKYQVEFGSAGKGLTELEKEEIEKLNLPGIDFIEDEKRYYPNGDFTSYTLGYAQNDEDGKIDGEFGLEDLLNDVLSGTDGYTTYQKDLNGYKIPGTKEVTVDAIDGNDVYLTIDSNIQFFLEQAANKAEDKYKFDWLTLIVADAKTGKILGSTQKPSFDPNKKNIENWTDITVGEAYEPGSIMKIYTYMAAMEAGTYRGDSKFKSGRYEADDGTVISDWNSSGFGNITYDQGFQASSNVGVINIVNNFINKKILEDYFAKMGFGQKTGITLANEVSGTINFKYQTEVYNASFGQGITTTPMQHIKALTSIANDGIMLKPYIIDKVVDENGKVVYEGQKEEIGRVASKQTAEKIRDLMYKTVNSDWYAVTGGDYRVKNSSVIGKTGTAQLVNSKTGSYYTDDYNVTKSFVGMWPKEDPEVIIYASVKRAGTSKPISDAVTEIVKNINKYLNIFKEEKEEKDVENQEVDNYLNKELSLVKTETKEVNKLIIGTGSKVINQYPEKGEVIDSNETLILLTNSSSYKMPDLTGYSKSEAKAVCEMLNLKCTFKGYGYIKSQSIKNKTVKENDKVSFTLK
ncbi:MAG: penicillin-binding transpeptidase domain-containing protein [Bacilli bacterium]